MSKNSDKGYKCPYCSQSSSRKYNINIHIQRKHQQYPKINNANPSPLVNDPHSLIDFENSAYNWNTSMQQQPSSSAFLTSPTTFTFYPDTFFYYNKVKNNDEKERIESRRRFDKTFLEYMQKIVIPRLRLQSTQINYSNKVFPTPIFIDPKNMPKAFRIYKCDKCFRQTLEPFFDFKEIHPANKFRHNCSCSKQQQKPEDNNDTKIKTLKLQEILVSVIDDRLKLENKPIKMIVFPDNLSENSLSLKLLIFAMDIVENIVENKGGEDDPFRWLFELVEKEGFIDPGEISSQHWTNRAYYNYNDNENNNYINSNYYLKEKVTKLENEELKQFISMTEGTFGLIKFRIDNNKTIYTFSYLPLYNLKQVK